MVEAIDHDSDNLPIGTILDLSLQNTALDTRYSYDHTNTNVFNSTLSASLLLIPSTSSTPEVLDKYIAQLINEISHTVHIFPPQTVPNVQVTLSFDGFWKAACVKANKARRHLKEKTKQHSKSLRKKQPYVTYRKARAFKKRLVQSTLWQHQQKQIEEAKRDAHKTWKLVRWIKNRAIPYQAFTLYMKRQDRTKVFPRTAKAECLVEFFFAQIPNSDQEDIGHTAYQDPVAFPTIDIEEI